MIRIRLTIISVVSVLLAWLSTKSVFERAFEIYPFKPSSVVLLAILLNRLKLPYSYYQDICDYETILIFSWNTLPGLQTHNPLSPPKSFLNIPNIFHDLQETC